MSTSDPPRQLVVDSYACQRVERGELRLSRAAARTFSAMAPKKDDKKKDPKGKVEAEPEGKSTHPRNPSPRIGMFRARREKRLHEVS